MKPQRYYKINIRSSILRQIVFTDVNIFTTVCLSVVGFFFYVFKDWQTEVKVFSSIILIGFIFLFATSKIDNQKIYEVIPRIIKYLLKKRNVRY